MTKLTYADVLARVEPIVTERPTTKAMCAYFDYDYITGKIKPDEPLCIVGNAFADELRPVIAANTHLNSLRFDAIVRETLPDGLTMKASRFLSRLQSEQDGRSSWAVALELAKDEVAEYPEEGYGPVIFPGEDDD